MSRPADERVLDADPEPRPELSPWWGLTLVLAEIAEHVERRRAEEHTEDVA